MLDMDVKLPVIKYFVMGMNRWKTAEDWPLPRTEWTRFFLHSRGNANSLNGDGLLNRDEPVSESPDMFLYNPEFPVPTNGGHFTPAILPPGPLDQSPIERGNDVLCYTTAELEKDMEVTGPIELHLFAATSTRDTDFTAKLVNVYPDGRAYNVADGVIRARYRKSISQPEPVSPGEVNEYVINMRNSSCLFRKGHRIRIDVSSSDFPRWDRNMNTSNAIGEDTEGIPAMQTVYHETGCASYIDLPVIS
jgi:putative CocE/NonD family hydrolase